MKNRINRLFALLATLSLLALPVPANAAPAKPGKPVLSSASEENAANDEAQVLVTWTASEGPSLRGHSVRLSGGGVTLDGQESCVENVSCTATFTGLTGGTAYTATVTAIDTSGVTSTPDVSDQFVALSSPTSPQNRVVTASGTDLVLTWTEPANTGGSPITSYAISAPGSDFQAATVAGSLTSYTATGLTRGNTYTFQIAAVNAIGTSSTVSFLATVAPDVPDAPSAPTTAASGQQVTVDWVAPDDNGAQIQTYVVTLYREGAVVETANNVAGALDTYDFIVATSGNYQATVAARNVVGLGPASPLSQTAEVTGGTALQSNLPVFIPSNDVVLGITATQAVSATAPSGEPVVLRSSTPLICSLSAGIVTALTQGTCIITGTASATETYDEGVRSLTILVKLPKTISFADVPTQSFPGTLDLSGRATTSSGETVTFTASGNCSMQTATVVEMDSTGSCTVSANSAATDGFFAAPQIQRTFSITSGSSGGPVGGGGFVPATPPVLTLKPSLTGTASTGEFLVASPGQWQNQENLDFAYRWFKCDSELVSPTKSQVEAACVVIENARLIRYLVGEPDSGKHLLVEVTAVNALSLETVSYSNTVFFGSQATTPASQEPAYWPKKLTDNSIKLYAKNIVGVGKVQFFLNGKEIAWVRAVDETDPKLRKANGFNYLVRTVNLKAGQKNAVEIYVDGERVRRAAYTVR